MKQEEDGIWGGLGASRSIRFISLPSEDLARELRVCLVQRSRRVGAGRSRWSRV